MIRWIRKHLALRSYRGKLAPALVKRYGRQRHYTVKQVQKTVEVLGLNLDFACYAYAAFCERDDFDAHHAALGEACDWSAMHDFMVDSHWWTVGVEHALGDFHLHDVFHHHQHHDLDDPHHHHHHHHGHDDGT